MQKILRTKWLALILPVVVVTAISLFSLLDAFVVAAASSQPGGWLYGLQQPALELQQRFSVGRTDEALAAAFTTPGDGSSRVELDLGVSTATKMPPATPTSQPTATPTANPTSTAMPTAEPTSTATPTQEPAPTVTPTPQATATPQTAPTPTVTPSFDDDNHGNRGKGGDDDGSGTGGDDDGDKGDDHGGDDDHNDDNDEDD